MGSIPGSSVAESLSRSARMARGIPKLLSLSRRAMAAASLQRARRTDPTRIKKNHNRGYRKTLDSWLWLVAVICGCCGGLVEVVVVVVVTGLGLEIQSPGVCGLKFSVSLTFFWK